MFSFVHWSFSCLATKKKCTPWLVRLPTSTLNRQRLSSQNSCHISLARTLSTLGDEVQLQWLLANIILSCSLRNIFRVISSNLTLFGHILKFCIREVSLVQEVRDRSSKSPLEPVQSVVLQISFTVCHLIPTLRLRISEPLDLPLVCTSINYFSEP